MTDARTYGFMLTMPVLAISQSVYAKDYLSTEQAQTLLFPKAESFAPHTVSLSKAQKKAIKKLSGVRQRWDEQKVWKAVAGGKTLGWFIIDEVVGKHEFITYAAALSADGHVLGLEVMSYRETHGDEVMRPDWRAQFRGKTLGDVFQLDEDIANISGATLSCRNLTDGVHRLLALQKLVLNNG